MLNLTLIVKGFKVIIFKFPFMIISYTSNDITFLILNLFAKLQKYLKNFILKS